MAEHFDPYFKWLGIPPEEQPANHYRLLGVPLFIDDADVIGNAADRQMMMLRSMQAGARSMLSQKLLNEISQARACLLNAERKAAYDEALRAAPPAGNPQTKQPSSAAPSEPGSDPAASDALAGLDFEPRPSATVRPGMPPAAAPRKKAAPQRRESPAAPRRSISPAWYAIGAGLLAVVATVTFLVIGRGKQPAATTSNSTSTVDKPVAIAAPAADKPTTVVTRPANQPTKNVFDNRGRLDPPRQVEAATTTNRLAEDPMFPPVAPPLVDNPPPPDKEVVRQPPRREKPAPPPIAPVRAPAAPQPVPEAAIVVAKTKELHELLKDDFKQAQASADVRQRLCTKLIGLARGSLANDLPSAYACATEATELAIEGGNIDEAFVNIDWLAKHFVVADAASRKEEAVRRMKIDAVATDSLPELVSKLEAKLDAAEDVADYALALELAKVALRAARKAKEPALVSKVQVRGKRLVDQRKYYEAAVAARKTLATSPEDPTANLEWGRFLCFVRGNWDAGLPHLAAGSDTDLAALAKRDLAHPAAPQQQSELADAWWAQSEDASNAGLTEIKQRAAHYYSKAVPHLAGLDKVRAQQRAAVLRTEKLVVGGQPDAKKAPPVNVLVVQLPKVGLEYYRNSVLLGQNMELSFGTVTRNGRDYPGSLGIGIDPLVMYRFGFKTGKQFSSIQGTFYNQRANSSGGVVFHVLADNRRVWKSQPLTAANGDVEFKAAIPNAQIVQIVVESVSRELTEPGWYGLTVTKKEGH